MKYLTKSKFKTALECPTKLYYSAHPDTFGNKKLDDPFLAALAKGGFQVGELSKCYYPDGIDITTLDKKEALHKTNEALKKENVVIFEAAIVFENLFIRVDILEKIGNTINLIEVKSKSCDPDTFEDELWDSRSLKRNERKLKTTWKSYLYDVAFQGYVMKKALPEFKINHWLMCADKTKMASVDGLNQKFKITELNGRTTVDIIGSTSIESLGEKILTQLDCNEVVSIIHNEEEMSERFNDLGFEGAIEKFSKAIQNDEIIRSAVGNKCKNCEFRVKEPEKESGFDDCFVINSGLSEEELKEPFAFDVWNFRGAAKAIEDGRILIKDLDLFDIKINQKEDGSLSNGERQALQIEKIKDNDNSPYIDLDGLSRKFSEFTYPLHMIDFETCMSAIPFNKGRRPYEQIAFQFSHHIIYEDGKVEHAGEYINNTVGFFPNFEFVRQLKKSLGEKGAIFRYSNHENTVLCQIREQLLESDQKDKEELVTFIETITAKKKGKDYLWYGERNMIDLCELVKGYYYSPLTNGSNSIKYVLPAILNESKYLQEKYSKPIYTTANFKNHKWINIKDNKVQDPYKTLLPIFNQYDYEKLELVFSDTDIANGGAALTAYSMMQFSHMSNQERQKITEALLRYCELDTFAMVMIYEHWFDLIQSYNANKDVA